jgi:hypothetical protein
MNQYVTNSSIVPLSYIGDGAHRKPPLRQPAFSSPLYGMPDRMEKSTLGKQDAGPMLQKK